MKGRFARFFQSGANTPGRQNDPDGEAPQTGPAGATTAHPILDGYAVTAPDPAAAVSIFAGEWSSRLPPPCESLGGPAELFDDDRIHWLLERCGGVEGANVLELGPLEGGHTTMLARAGAAEVVAIEANRRAYLKCLIVKEWLGLETVRFLHGDFTAYLESPERRFDLVVASGVLYHMLDPVELIARIAAVTDRLFLWTHYHDEALIGMREDRAWRFPSSETAECHGFAHTLHRHDYVAALDWAGFCGGSSATSNWMSRADILGALRHFGFSEFEIAFESPDHPNGPSFALLARRPPPA